MPSLIYLKLTKTNVHDGAGLLFRHHCLFFYQFVGTAFCSNSLFYWYWDRGGVLAVLVFFFPRGEARKKILRLKIDTQNVPWVGGGEHSLPHSLWKNPWIWGPSPRGLILGIERKSTAGHIREQGPWLATGRHAPVHCNGQRFSVRPCSCCHWNGRVSFWVGRPRAVWPLADIPEVRRGPLSCQGLGEAPPVEPCRGQFISEFCSSWQYFCRHRMQKWMVRFSASFMECSSEMTCVLHFHCI